MMKKAAIALAMAACAPAMAQVYKCPDAGGRTVIQQIPCAGGKELDVRPASGRTTAPLPSAGPAGPAPVAAAPAPAAAQPPAPAAPAKSPLEREADMCLAWYLPMLKNPRGAYYTRPSKDGRVVTITVHATNSYGGVVTETARCEIHNGKLDEGWTKTHAERLKW